MDLQKLKTMSDKLSAEDREALDHLLAAVGTAADSDGDGKADIKGLKALFHKDGEFSKTSVILTVAWSCGLAMWLIQGLGSGGQVFGHTIPPFDSNAALAMLGAASSLYFATHNVRANVGSAAVKAE